MNIPVQNVFHLLCYAWDCLPPKGVVTRSQLVYDRITNLLAAVLHSSVSSLIKHGLEREFGLDQIDTGRIRGKIDLSSSVKRATMRRQELACWVPRLSYNTPANRVIRATLIDLTRQNELDPRLRDSIKSLLGFFSEIPSSQSVQTDLRRIYVHRNNRVYRLTVSICRFWWERWLAQDREGNHYFPDFTRDDRRMRDLFERFVRNFYKAHLTDARVSKTKSQWQTTSGTPQALAMLPRLETDVVITGSGHQVVIDTKYTTSTREYRGVVRAREGHLFQLFAYAANMKADPRFNAKPLAASLLYPVVDNQRDVAVEVLGTPISVRHLNLSQPWDHIEKRLIDLYRQEADRAVSAKPAAFA